MRFSLLLTVDVTLWPKFHLDFPKMICDLQFQVKSSFPSPKLFQVTVFYHSNRNEASRRRDVETDSEFGVKSTWINGTE